jgi:C4-dicarboxylate-specific signal transduction histidine kinase
MWSYFSEAGFMPHGHCYLWNPGLVWTHVVTDLLIGLAYVSISLSLYSLIRKIQLPFSAMVLSFGVFIGACGATHFMEVWNLWYASYWWAAFVKVLTAIASVATGLWLIKLKPQIIAVAEAAKLSEQRREQLEKANHELGEQQKVLAHSAKMSALGEMAGGIAHEINSPLGIITVHANQLERFSARGALTPEMIKAEAQLIAATAKRIGEIIKGLRAFAREGEKDPFVLTPAATIINDALVLCQNRFISHGIELRITPPAPGIELECRPVQIGQVLLNLLSNSFDAVVGRPEKWVALETTESAGQVHFTVTDSGAGVPEEIAAKLFQPFFTTKELGKGTGLGLSISKGIADAHQGTLTLDPRSSRTRFVLCLPQAHHEKASP